MGISLKQSERLGQKLGRRSSEQPSPYSTELRTNGTQLHGKEQRKRRSGKGAYGLKQVRWNLQNNSLVRPRCALLGKALKSFGAFGDQEAQDEVQKRNRGLAHQDL